MIRRLRVVLPPVFLVLGGLLFALVQAFFLFLEWLTQQPYFSNPSELLLYFLAVFYAGYRVAAFHPALRKDYYPWLCNTPWTSRQPLPLGPIHLVWQDGLVLALGVGLVWVKIHLLQELPDWQAVSRKDTMYQYLMPVRVFLFVFLCALGFAHFVTGQKPIAFALGLGLGLLIRFWSEAAIYFPVALVSYAAAYWGLRRSLADFPWQADSRFQKWNQFLDQAFSGSGLKKFRNTLGWPYDRLGLKYLDIPRLTLGETLLLGLLGGWWYYALFFHQGRPREPGGIYPLFFLFLCGGVLARIFFYANGYLPPLNLLGRLLRGRWIIPSYDKIFAAPILAGMVGVGLVYGPSWTGLQPLLLTPIAFTLTFWILFGIGPDLQVWRLTGNHRIVPGLFLDNVHRVG